MQSPPFVLRLLPLLLFVCRSVHSITYSSKSYDYLKPFPQPPTGISYNSFGHSMDTDGNRMVSCSVGFCTIYNFNTTSKEWVYETETRDEVKPGISAADLFFNIGAAVAISENFLVTSSPDAYSDAGVVYVYQRATCNNGGIRWLVGDNWAAGSRCGESVHLLEFEQPLQNQNGYILVPTALLAFSCPGENSGAGAIYVYRIDNPDPNQWYLEKRVSYGLTSFPPPSEIPGDSFGHPFSMTYRQDGIEGKVVMAVGIPGSSIYASNAGVMHVFERWFNFYESTDPSAIWVCVGAGTIPWLGDRQPAADDKFPAALAVSENYVFAGLTTLDGSSGAVIVLQRTNGAGYLVKQVLSLPEDVGSVSGALLGFSIAASLSDSIVAAGAPGLGLVFVWQKDNEGTFHSITPLGISAPSVDSSDDFGSTVALTLHSLLLVGAKGDDTSGLGINPPVDDYGTDVGAVYSFRPPSEEGPVDETCEDIYPLPFEPGKVVYKHVDKMDPDIFDYSYPSYEYFATTIAASPDGKYLAVGTKPFPYAQGLAQPTLFMFVNGDDGTYQWLWQMDMDSVRGLCMNEDGSVLFVAETMFVTVYKTDDATLLATMVVSFGDYPYAEVYSFGLQSIAFDDESGVLAVGDPAYNDQNTVDGIDQNNLLVGGIFLFQMKDDLARSWDGPFLLRMSNDAMPYNDPSVPYSATLDLLHHKGIGYRVHLLTVEDQLLVISGSYYDNSYDGDYDLSIVSVFCSDRGDYVTFTQPPIALLEPDDSYFFYYNQYYVDGFASSLDVTVRDEHFYVASSYRQARLNDDFAYWGTEWLTLSMPTMLIWDLPLTGSTDLLGTLKMTEPLKIGNYTRYQVWNLRWTVQVAFSKDYLFALWPTYDYDYQQIRQETFVTAHVLEGGTFEKVGFLWNKDMVLPDYSYEGDHKFIATKTNQFFYGLGHSYFNQNNMYGAVHSQLFYYLPNGKAETARIVGNNTCHGRYALQIDLKALDTAGLEAARAALEQALAAAAGRGISADASNGIYIVAEQVQDEITRRRRRTSK